MGSMDRRRMLRLGALAAVGAGLGVHGASASGAVAPTPEVVRRPEIRELSGPELNRFVSAVQELHSGSTYRNLVLAHYRNAAAWHGTPAFLPSTRVYLARFEEALRSIDASVTLPYWDWSLDALEPERSAVFTNNYFGGNGRSPDHVVNTGPFANWQCTVPSNHLLRRNFNAKQTITPFLSVEVVDRIVAKETSYDGLCRSLERANGHVHNGIGGIGGDMSYMHSPNDPLFWVSECFVDVLWSEWQQRNPKLAGSYNGKSATGVAASDSDTLHPFGVTVSSVLDTRTLGYTYKRWSVNSAERPPTA